MTLLGSGSPDYCPQKIVALGARVGLGFYKMHKLDCRLLDLPSRLLGLFKSIQIFTESQAQAQAQARAQSQFIFIKSKTFTCP